MRNLILLIGFTFLMFQKSKADFILTAPLKAAYVCNLHLKPPVAYALISKAKAENPTNSLVYYFETQTLFIETFLSEDKNKYESFLKLCSKNLDLIAKDGTESPWKVFVKSDMLLYSGLVRAKFADYISAVNDFRKSYNAINENQRAYPNFALNLKNMGLMDVIIGSVPENYQWAVKLVGFDGDFNRGISRLKQIPDKLKGTNQDIFITETNLTLAFLLLNLKDKDGAWDIIKDVNDPENVFLLIVKASIARHTGRNDLAIELLNSRAKIADVSTLPYLDYLHGVCLLNKLDPQCVYFLSSFLGANKGTNYIKDAYLRIGWSKFLQGDISSYKTYMRFCNQYGTTIVDIDKSAHKESENTENPDVNLLKARLLFDGGYYDKAMLFLSSMDTTKGFTGQIKAEYFYRLGRIYHETDNTEKAVLLYLKTIQLGYTQNEYFAASSCLKLGQLFEKKESFIEAKTYYNRTNTFKNHPYTNSISRDAKAGLNRISKGRTR